MMARANITDRAHRYRANQLAPVAGKVCLLCGSTQFLVPDHWDGHPDHTHAENLEVLCKSCNTAKGAAFKAAGRGRLTDQYNPTKGGGAATVGEWMQAVGAITPHVDRGERGLVSTMSTRDAVDMIRATPQSNRRDFAAKMRRRNPGWFSRPDARRTTPASGGIAHHTAKRRAGGTGGGGPKSKKAAGPVSVPDEATLRAGFARGLTLADMLGVRNPGMPVSDWKKDFYRQGFEIGKADRTKEYPTFADANKVNEQAFWMADILVESWGVPKSKRDDIAGQFSRGYSDGWRGHRRKKSNPAAFDRCVKAVQAKGGAVNAYAVCKSSMKGKRNPAAASAEAFEKFHGYEPSEVIIVRKKIFYHKHLAAAGELPFLKLWGIDDQGHTISKFKGTVLAFNEDMNQLFAEGGDQGVNLADFGITRSHELETLGRLTDIGYHTTKTHLGAEGGTAVYVHKFRTTNDGGKHVVVKIARYPDLIYDVRNEQLLFSGGSYEIIAEGIDK